jgi:hypothetical protein
MRSKFAFYSIIIFLLYSYPLTILAQDYLWPTNASEFMSSSFCEFRDGHYHAAIDIKTWNTEGYPCYAIEDGYIKRIRVSPFGYGKVIYLQLNDGNTVIYAHLQKFTKQVEKLVREQQFRNKKYRLDWWPKNLKVKKGEIIAYTGRTGIGVPHLHFEIRNKQDNPVNPLRYYSQIKDRKRPKLQDLLIIPLTQTTTVNGSFLPQKYTVSRVKDDIHVIKKPIVVQGKVGLAIRGYDQADQVYNKYGFYKSTLESSDKLIFQMTYDELDYATTDHIFTEIYYPFWSSEKQIFNKLYVEPFNPLNFYNRNLGSDGSIAVTDNPVPFKITISDFMNNQSIIKGELVPVNNNILKILNSSIEDSSLYIKFSSPPVRDLKFYMKRKNQSWSEVNYFEIVEGSLINPSQNKIVRLKLNDSTITSFKIAVNKIYEQTISVSQKYDEDEIKNNMIYLGNRMIAQFQGKFNNPRIQTNNYQTVLPYNFSRSDELQVVLPSKLIADKNAKVLIDDIYGNTKSITLDHHTLVPGERRSFFWFDSSLVLESSANSVSDTTLVTAVKDNADSLSIEIPTSSEIYDVKPDNFPIFQSLELSIRADSLPAWGKWSIFKTNGKDRYQYLKTEIDANKMYLSARTTSLGKFVIATDTIPPEVSIESPKSGKLYKSTPSITIILKDSFSGIEGENNFSLLMDGDYVLPEWDPEEDLIVGFLENKLSAGNHTFSITVSDRSGNITRKAVYFKIQ